MSNKKRKHRTTKNTMPKSPVHRFNNFQLDINGPVSIVTEISECDFDRLYREWWDHPDTFMWCGESLVGYLNKKQPEKLCLLKEDYDRLGPITATKEEWEAENN